MIAKSRLLLLSTACLVLTGAASAQAATVAVKCSATKTIQAAINSAAAGVSTTINASGTCSENITVPRGKIIIIAGTLGGTTITAKNGALPALISYGDTTVQTLAIAGTGAADAAVQAELGGVLQLIGVDVSGPATDSVIGIWDNSTATIMNSRVGPGVSDAIDLANSASLVLGANPGLPQGPDGPGSATVQDQVFCGPGSSLFIRVKKAGSSNGSLNVTSGRYASIGGIQCDLSLVNKTTDPTNFQVNSTAGNGIVLDKSTLSLVRGTISNNAEQGIKSNMSSATVSASVLSGNGSSDIEAGPGSTIFIDSFNGASSMPDAYTANKLTCWPIPGPHGHILFDDAGLTGGDNADVIASNDAECVTRLGP